MQRVIDPLANEDFDLLVLGGGITGAGVALDAVLRGMRVALIDKGDFASGTSSVSSKLVHGGLRYLEHGDFRLVGEALHERRRLLRNAPHLVRPLRFVMPFYKGARVPFWKGRIGLSLYDFLAGPDNLRPSRSLPLATLRRQLPDLNPAGLTGAVEYFDAQMDDARLCLEVLHTAARHGARVANYVEAVAFAKEGGRVRGVRAADRLGGGELDIRARQVVNATGPWGDRVRRLAGDDGAAVLRPTRGVHLVGPGRGRDAALLLLHPADGRVFFVIPWMGKTLLGTTDTECDDSPDSPRVGDADIRYLLEGHNHYLSPGLNPGEVLGQFAGLRPLLRDDADAPSARSREFHLFDSPTGLLSVAGGKYTTYRHMAEVITDAVARRLGNRQPCRTRDFPLLGAPRQPWDHFEAGALLALSRRQGLPEDTARHLVYRYGQQAFLVAGWLERDPKLGRSVVAGEPDVLAEFAHQRDQEMAERPADFLLRRTRLGLFRPDLLHQPPALTRPGSVPRP